MNKLINTNNAEATEKFGEQLGRNLRGGEVIELVSDLGGGKTTLVRGIARGASSGNVVGSPTFTISKVYNAKNCDIYHYDFYRLNDPGLIIHELAEVLEDPKAVIIVEWSNDAVRDVLSSHRMVINIIKTGEFGRQINCNYPQSLAYMMGKA